jgi:hypothetical protein
MLDQLVGTDGVTLNHNLTIDTKSSLILGVVIFVALMLAFTSSFIIFKNK